MICCSAGLLAACLSPASASDAITHLCRHINAQGFLAAAAKRMAAIEALDLTGAAFGNDPCFRLHFQDLPSLKELTLLEARPAALLCRAATSTDAAAKARLGLARIRKMKPAGRLHSWSVCIAECYQLQLSMQAHSFHIVAASSDPQHAACTAQAAARDAATGRRGG